MEIDGDMANVSIIIPVFNVESYIKESIESCIEQTLPDVEIVIINDGSTDSSDEIIREYTNKFPNIKYKTIEHGGLSVARNNGIQIASGRYLLFLDADDYISTDACEKLFNQAEKDNLDFITFDAEVFSDDNSVNLYLKYFSYDRFGILKNTITTGKDFLKIYKDTGGVRVNACLSFVRRNLIIEHCIKFPEGLFYEDNVFFLQCMIYAKKISYNGNKFYKRRVRENSIMTQTITLKHLLDAYIINLKLIEALYNYIHIGNVDDDEIYFWLDYIIGHTILGILNKQPKSLLAALYRNYFSQIKNIIAQCVSRVIEVLDYTNPMLENISILDRYIEAITEYARLVPSDVINIFKNYKTEILKSKISIIPFQNSELRIGIYGSGPHSDFVLNLYKNLIGEIKAQIFYIDSTAKSYDQKHNDIEVVNVSDVNFSNVDALIILSYKFENEMKENVLKNLSFSEEKTKIFTFYDGENYPIDFIDSHERKYAKYRKDAEEHRVFLINTPAHDNIGDHIIAEQTKKLIHEAQNDAVIVEVTGEEYVSNPWRIREKVGWLDTVIVNGGGYFGDLWGSGKTLLDIAKMFRENRLILMPQSLTFKNEIEDIYINEWKDVLDYATDIKLLWRDDQSYKKAVQILGFEDRHFLIPDVALFSEAKQEKQNRNGIILCLRNDAEGLLSDNDKEILKSSLSQFANVKETSMHYGAGIPINQRDLVIDEKFKELSSAELVITDTLHCMISCALTGTKCIAMPNSTGKVLGVYEWIKDLDYIKFSTNYEEAKDSARELLDSNLSCEYIPKLAKEKQQLIDILEESIKFIQPIYVNVACADKDKMYFLDCHTDYLFERDILTGEIKILAELNLELDKGMKCAYIAKYNEYIWMIPWSSSCIFTYNLNNKQLKEYSLSNDTQLKYYGYRRGVVDGDYLWLLPKCEQCIYRINMNNFMVKRVNAWPKKVTFDKNAEMNFKCMNLADGKIFLFADGCSNNLVIDTDSLNIDKMDYESISSFGVVMSSETTIVAPTHRGENLKVFDCNKEFELNIPEKAWQKEEYYSFWYCTVVDNKAYIMPHEANGILYYDNGKKEVEYINLTGNKFDSLRSNPGFSGYDAIPMGDFTYIIPYMGAQLLELRNNDLVNIINLQTELPADLGIYYGKYQVELGTNYLERYINTAFINKGKLIIDA